MNPHTYKRNKPLTYISIFSGIEAASVAWEPLGFIPLAFAEVDPFPTEVLKARFPHVPNLGDVTKIDWSEFNGKTDILVGGSPCQAFSIAGKREGLADERGKLMLEYVRAVREVQPSYCIWENVPGALSQDGGRAFATLLEELEECGYALAWRVLDAQYFGVAQRRRRVFLVGVSENRFPFPGAAIERAGEILFEPESLCGDYPSSKQKREELARAARHSTTDSSNRHEIEHQSLNLYENHGTDARVKGPVSVCPSVLAHYGTGGNNTPLVHKQTSAVSYALAANTIDRAPHNGGNGLGATEELSYTLTAMDRHAVTAPAGPLNPWDNQTSRVYHRQGIAPTITSNNAGGYKAGAVLDQGEPAYTMVIRGGHGQGGRGALWSRDLSLTLATQNSQTLFQPQRIVCLGDENTNAACDVNLTGTLKTYGSPPIINDNECNQSDVPRTVVRRLTPVECERLQGFPDNWTRIVWKGKPEEDCPDTPRYKAIGNSMAVPVMRILGMRLAEA